MKPASKQYIGYSKQKAQVCPLKRLASLFLVLTMLFLLCVPAGAQEDSAPIQHPGQPVLPSASAAASQTEPTAVPAAEPSAQPTPEPTEEPMTDLASGSRGIWVERLQTRLTELGYLSDAVDGKFGYNTQQAVLALENGLRTLEQRALDAESGVSLPGGEDAASAEPTPAPTPETVADGIAETSLLEEILPEDFELYLEDVTQGSRGTEARRVQTRLYTLNYLSEQPDGSFGANSLAALSVFQQANGLEETGVADRRTQSLLFSARAIRAEQPVYNQLTAGMTNDRVKAAQRQLIALGFMTGSAGGYFNERTTAGVKALQKYLHQLEKDKLAASATATPAPEPTATPRPDLVQAQYTPVPSATAVPELDDGYEGDGVLTHDLQVLLFDEGIPVIRQAVVKSGDSGDEVLRVQRRLQALDYLTAGSADGLFGGATERALSKFQSRNRLQATGVADEATQLALYSEDAVRAMKPYLVKVSVDDQQVYVYALDDNDQYSILTRTMTCSTGLRDTPTPTGEFTYTGPGARWHYFKKWKCWAQYAYYIDGDIMFHSVLYNSDDESTLVKSSVRNLGRRASHGCVRLSVEDARWLWNNCPGGTHVIVY